MQSEMRRQNKIDTKNENKENICDEGKCKLIVFLPTSK